MGDDLSQRDVTIGMVLEATDRLKTGQAAICSDLAALRTSINERCAARVEACSNRFDAVELRNARMNGMRNSQTARNASWGKIGLVLLGAAIAFVLGKFL